MEATVNDMKEIEGDIWDYHGQGRWIVITTNGTVRKDGACVMGRGVAFQAKQRFPDLPYMLGTHIIAIGNGVFNFTDYRIIAFPVKHNWHEQADLELIASSVTRLVLLAGSLFTSGYYEFANIFPLYMVRPGCGNGKLDWETQVKPILEKYLDDRFIVVEKFVKP